MRRQRDRDRRPHGRAGRSRTGVRPRSAFCVRRSHRLKRRQGLGSRHRLDDRRCRGCGFPGFPALAAAQGPHREPRAPARRRTGGRRTVRAGGRSTTPSHLGRLGETRVRLAAEIVSAGASPAVGESAISLGGGRRRLRFGGRLRSRRRYRRRRAGTGEGGGVSVTAVGGRRAGRRCPVLAAPDRRAGRGRDRDRPAATERGGRSAADRRTRSDRSSDGRRGARRAGPAPRRRIAPSVPTVRPRRRSRSA